MGYKESEFVETSSYPDRAKNIVTVGDIIVYGHNLGRCASLRYGKVLKIREATYTGERYKRVENTDQIWWPIEGKIYRITVQGVNDDSYHDDNDNDKVSLCKKGTLMFANRTLKVPVELVPDNVKNLLEKVDLA